MSNIKTAMADAVSGCPAPHDRKKCANARTDPCGDGEFRRYWQKQSFLTA